MSRGRRWKGRSYRHQRPRHSDDSEKLTPSERKLLHWGKRQKLRDGSGGIFLEGAKLLQEALLASHPLDTIWFTYDFEDEYPGIVAKLRETGATLKQVSEKSMKLVTDMETPPGIVAVGPEPGFIFREPEDSISLIVVLAQVQDPGNLGGVIRTADYFGVDELWLGPGSTDPYSSKCIRGSMGATFRLPVRRIDNLTTQIEMFRQAGAEVWAATAQTGSSGEEISPTGKRILMIGGESRGLSDEYLGITDKTVTIQGAGKAESLNLAVAAGILIYNATTGRYKPETKKD